MDATQIRSKLIGSEDERAVSPVIGVILMVAITVILAAVIAAFVLDMSPGGSETPQASYDWTGDASNGLEVRHNGGDDVPLENVGVGGDISDGDFDSTASGSLVTSSGSLDENEVFSAGDTLVIPATNLNAGDTVTLTWENGDQTQILTEGEA